MSFLNPAAFAFGLLLPVIVALYLLKLKRIEHPVPSTYLWRKMVRDVEANAPWQKLRPNLLMILQLLFLAALILALTRPFTWAEGPGGEAAIFIIDSSASMSATDVAPSRLESAKQRALQLVDDLPDSARVTVIEAGREARVALSSSLDRRQAHLALQQIQPTTGGSDLAIALQLASAIAARQPGAEILVLSDGRVDLPKRLAIKAPLRYIPFGLSGDNQAISQLSLEAGTSPADNNPDASGSSPASGSNPAADASASAALGKLTAFAQVSNYGEKPAARRLNLYADGSLVNAFDLADIPPGGQKTVIAEDLPAGTQVIEARLTGADALPMDDRAYAVRPEAQPVPVTLVTSGNRFIKTALTLLPGIVLTEQEAGSAGPGPQTTGTPSAATPTAPPTPTPEATSPAADAGTPLLTIFDNNVPAVLPPTGSLLFIAPTQSTQYFTTTGLAQNPTARAVDPNDPLLQNITLANISIMDAVRIPLPDWATPVVSGEIGTTAAPENTPLLFRGEVDGRRIAVLAFDLRHSDLPLQVAFPLLWSNLVDWLAPGARNPIPTRLAPGETLSFSIPQNPTAGASASKDAPDITLPDGTKQTLQVENGRYVFTDTTQLGIYQIHLKSAGGANPTAVNPAAFAINLFSPQESSVKPANSLAGLETQAGQSGAATQTAMREWWRPLALLALGLLTGEWLVYQRAALARLRDLLLRLPRKPGSSHASGAASGGAIGAVSAAVRTPRRGKKRI